MKRKMDAPVLPDDLPELLNEHGIEATGPAREAASEADRIFLVPAAGGGVVVRESPIGSASSHMQLNLLRHVAAVDPTLPIPRVLPRRTNGEIVRRTAGGEAHITTLLPGIPLEALLISEDLINSIVGVQIALQRALGDADAATVQVPDSNDWSHDAVVALDGCIDELTEPRYRAPLHAIVTEYVETLRPVLGELPRQVIHGDFNLSNILVHQDAVSGIVDFGDAVLTQRVWDFAVTACYLGLAVGDFDHPLVRHYLQRIDEHADLSATECAVLPALIRCRLALAVVQARTTARHSPARAPYALRYDHLGLAILDDLANTRMTGISNQ